MASDFLSHEPPTLVHDAHQADAGDSASLKSGAQENGDCQPLSPTLVHDAY